MQNSPTVPEVPIRINGKYIIICPSLSSEGKKNLSDERNNQKLLSELEKQGCLYGDSRDIKL